MTKWKHEALFDCARDRVRVQCKCGKQSPLFTGEACDQEAADWYSQHVGLKEQTRKREVVEDEEAI